MLRSLDLFAGIGGIAHGLRGYASPAMYCEIDPECQKILRKLMAEKRLPRAPIHGDVSTLNGRELRGKVDLIAGGSPCIGFSHAGKGEGFDNMQSKLYAHIIRLIGEVQPTYVFLENVAAITEGQGLDSVLKTLGAKGYDAVWMCLYAFNVGSPQKRRRWFCLATRRGTPPKTLTSRTDFKPFDWRREPVARLCAQPDPTRNTRMHMLGNTAVPDVVRLAFRCLWQGLTPAHPTAELSKLMWAFPDVNAKTSTKSASGMPCGACKARGTPFAVTCPELPPRRDWKLVLDPKLVPLPRVMNPLMTSGLVAAPHAMRDWATPRCSINSAARVLTRRCKNDLPTQLKFERSTKGDRQTGTFNPRWVEWLMGYERDWTLPPSNTVRITNDAVAASVAAVQNSAKTKKAAAVAGL